MSLTRQQKEFYKTFSQHGSGDAKVEIQPKDVALLVHIAYLDVFETSADWFIEEYASLAGSNFYEITPLMVSELPEINQESTFELLDLCGATNTNNVIYLYIDNRSTQETGYLFEPILASCLGGESVSHRYSPVKRIDDNGNPTSEGRQVDCYIEDAKEVYELKLRVTIAASGQGRFSEEMTFPYEARMAGLKPILVVFDPTPSPLLERLKAKYVEEGGIYAIGDDAWNLLTQQAGREMGKYIIKYIKPPISKMDEDRKEIPDSIKLLATNNSLVIEGNNGQKYEIPRE